MLLLNQGGSDVRQKRLLVGPNCVAIFVISRHLPVASWKSRHERIQLIFDLNPVPSAHRICPKAPMLWEPVYLDSMGAPFGFEFVVKNEILVD
jgi:hypothetical protein